MLVSHCTRRHDVYVVNCAAVSYRVKVIDGTIVTESAVRGGDVVRVPEAVRLDPNDTYTFVFSRAGDPEKQIELTGTQLQARNWIVSFCGCEPAGRSRPR
jgi:hypothetical protein